GVWAFATIDKMPMPSKMPIATSHGLDRFNSEENPTDTFMLSPDRLQKILRRLRSAFRAAHLSLIEPCPEVVSRRTPSQKPCPCHKAPRNSKTVHNRNLECLKNSQESVELPDRAQKKGGLDDHLF